MKSVLYSVINQWRKITITILLLLIVAYWYAIWAFFNDDVRGNYMFENRMDCSTLLDCFRVHIDYGFSN